MREGSRNQCAIGERHL